MTLEQDLQTEQVIHLDLSEYTVVESDTPVREVVNQMRTDDRNCALVVENGKLVGIFTDRDVLRKVVDAPETWERPIRELMTPAPKTVAPNAAVREALDLMHTGHFRNVPAVDEAGHVVGNLTHYSVICFLADRFPEEIYNLPPEPERFPHARDGA